MATKQLGLVGLSKSSLDIFKSCPRCWWLKMNKKINRPDGIMASIMNGIDDCMKNVTEHSVASLIPSMYLTDFPGAKPFQDRMKLKKFMKWQTFQAEIDTGKHHVKIWGNLDDLIEWPDGRVSPHDFKSNGKERDWEEYTLKYNSLQADMYEILIKNEGLKTTGDAYFTYAWPIVDGFGKMVFNHRTIAFKADENRAIKTIDEAMDCMRLPDLPEASSSCAYCAYVRALA